MALAAGAWSETCLISITPYTSAGTTDVEFAALTETVDSDLGDKDIDQIVNLTGGRLVKYLPQEITTITFEGYPVDIDFFGATGISQAFQDIVGNWDTIEPLAVSATRNRGMFRIAILWTDDTTATSAAGATASGTNAYRIVFAHAYMTSMKPSFTDGILKFTFSFKCPAFNKNGIAQIREESGDATALPALNTYNATNYDPEATADFTW